MTKGLLKIMTIKKLLISIVISSLLFGCAFQAGITRLPQAPLYSQTVTFGTMQYVPFLRFCDYYGLDWDWDLVSQRIKVKRGNDTLVLRPDSNLALLNKKSIKLDYPIEYKDGAAYIPIRTAVFVSQQVFGLEEKPALIAKRHQIKTIVIDPGHGGKDSGAKGRYGTREKHVVLDIAKRLKRDLEKKGFRVLLTRQKDIAVPLYKRAAFANERGVDFFISIHANASRYSQARGFEVYYPSDATDDGARALAAAENASLKFEEGEITKGENLATKTTVWDMQLNENRRESKEMAYYICNITADSLGLKKRGVKGARFVVLKGAFMPAILVEVGFLTNRREESKLKNASFRERIAKAISRSISTYEREYERTNGFSK
ncbi:MAG: N-acetylmuramoyl-L-alanine amidase [Candidatus Omnitrophica bacterium]|nr:N-acetylmuramoyl-L-alanine amidase [Candidatus Omnitrophota bacterium]